MPNRINGQLLSLFAIIQQDPASDLPSLVAAFAAQAGVTGPQSLAFIQAVGEVLGELGYFDDPTSVDFDAAKARIAAAGDGVVQQALLAISPRLSAKPAAVIVQLSSIAASAQPKVDELVAQDSAIRAHRSASFPSGRPDDSDRDGQRVWDAIGSALSTVASDLSSARAELDRVNAQIVSLGG